MSPERLAILLSEQTVGTPAYILIEHELNLRIAKVQSRATLFAAGVGIATALAATALAAYLQSMTMASPPATPLNGDGNVSTTKPLAIPESKPEEQRPKQ